VKAESIKEKGYSFPEYYLLAFAFYLSTQKPIFALHLTPFAAVSM